MKCLARLSLVLLLSSCSAQWHLNKAVKKDPTILERDTLVVKDTVVVPPVVITDTVTTKLHDTIVVEKDKLRVRVVKKLDTLIIEGQCDSDTIVMTIEVPVEKVVYVEKSKISPAYKFIGFFLMLLFVLGIFKRLIEKWLL